MVVDVAVFGIVIHAVLAVTSVFEIPLMRYLYPVWPLIALVLLRPLFELFGYSLSVWRARSGLAPSPR